MRSWFDPTSATKQAAEPSIPNAYQMADDADPNRARWRDAPNLFQGDTSANIEGPGERGSILFNEPKDLVKAEPPKGLTVPSQKEMEDRIAGSRMSPLRTEPMSRSEQADYEKQQALIKELGVGRKKRQDFYGL